MTNKENNTTLYQVRWLSYKNDNGHPTNAIIYGSYKSFRLAMESIEQWWSYNNFKPKLVRVIGTPEKDDVVTVDYGPHDKFYKIVKVQSKDNLDDYINSFTKLKNEDKQQEEFKKESFNEVSKMADKAFENWDLRSMARQITQTANHKDLNRKQKLISLQMLLKDNSKYIDNKLGKWDSIPLETKERIDKMIQYSDNLWQAFIKLYSELTDDFSDYIKVDGTVYDSEEYRGLLVEYLVEHYV